MSTSYSISQIAAEFGVTLRTLRFWEGRGLISPVRIANGRTYRESDRARLRDIMRYKAQGFSILQIKKALDGEGFTKKQIDEQIKLLRAQRQEIDQAIADLKMQRAA
jgi:DNA-binding transcriptional MerR regulator